MKKPYLLLAGWDYYPCGGTTDWKECYSTFTEATEAAEQYAVCNDMWYEIVDLRDWCE